MSLDYHVGPTSKDQPGVRCAAVPNLFFAGDSLGVPGIGGDAAANVAMACAEAAAQILKGI